MNPRHPHALAGWLVCVAAFVLVLVVPAVAR
jgi:hypothetical protein